MSTKRGHANNGTTISYGTQIYHTTNGGAIWTQQINPNTSQFGLQFVDFFDLNNGIIVGNAGLVLRTTNAGNLWTLEPSGTRNHLFSVHMNSPTSATAVGMIGTILRRSESGGSLVEQPQTGAEVPSHSLLRGSYPNPANGSTTLRYHVLTAGPVTIDLFDGASNRVLQLVDRRMEQGSYETTVDTRALPSGIYHYRIGTGGVAETTELVIVR